MTTTERARRNHYRAQASAYDRAAAAFTALITQHPHPEPDALRIWARGISECTRLAADARQQMTPRSARP